MITDAAGVPVDYRFVEVNPLFETMTGLVDPVGRTALEMVPDLEPHWIDTYGRVAFGNEPVRFQQGSDAMERWFDVFCVPVEPHGTFALVFKDHGEVLARPGQLLRMLDHFASTAGEADYTTVCCAELDASTRTLTYAVAGHLPILVVGADGSSQWLDEGRSPSLCTGNSAQRGQATVTIPDGALMIMYTDGLVERRGESIDQGLSRLQQVAVAARHDPADRVCQKLIEMAAETPTDDDTVVLCIRLRPAL